VRRPAVRCAWSLDESWHLWVTTHRTISGTKGREGISAYEGTTLRRYTDTMQVLAVVVNNSFHMQRIWKYYYYAPAVGGLSDAAIRLSVPPGPARRTCAPRVCHQSYADCTGVSAGYRLTAR